MSLPGGDEPVAAVERRPEHDVGSALQRRKGLPDGAGRDAGDVRRDEGDGAAADVCRDPLRQGARQAAALLEDEPRPSPGQRAQCLRIGRVGVENADAADLGPAGGERVEEERPVEIGRLLRGQRRHQAGFRASRDGCLGDDEDGSRHEARLTSASARSSQRARWVSPDRAASPLARNQS